MQIKIGCKRALVFIEIGAIATDYALAIHQHHFVRIGTEVEEQLHRADAGSAGAETYDLCRLQFFLLQLQRIQKPGAYYYRRAVLVVVKHRDIESIVQRLLDFETDRRGDIFQVDSAESRRDVDHGLDELFLAVGLDLDIEYVDVGKMFEQYGLAFQHWLRRQRAGIAESEYGGTIGNNRDKIALVGVAVGILFILRDRAYRLGHAGTVG